ncbi:MAG: hypothetical protein KJ623_00840 [Nanoarchaeota archaeon]|nr:hypothetical protein [Nanoarchaeota archaeon]MBU0963057.1 hypothetical protein [Nanoarchaeota archaeon]
MEKENPMYVYIENPVSFRKEILENAINTTTILKYYESLKIIRERKVKKIQEIRGLVLDMKKTNKSLINSMPELPEEKPKEIKEEKKEIHEKKEVKTVEKQIKIEPPKVHVSREEDQLTREIMDIQRKLKSL